MDNVLDGNLTRNDFRNGEDDRFVNVSNNVDSNNNNHSSISEGDVLLDNYDYQLEINNTKNLTWPNYGVYEEQLAEQLSEERNATKAALCPYICSLFYIPLFCPETCKSKFYNLL